MLQDSLIVSLFSRNIDPAVHNSKDTEALPTVFIAISSHCVDVFTINAKVASACPRIQLCFPVKWQASCIASSPLRPNMIFEDVGLWLAL